MNGRLSGEAQSLQATAEIGAFEIGYLSGIPEGGIAHHMSRLDGTGAWLNLKALYIYIPLCAAVKAVHLLL